MSDEKKSLPTLTLETANIPIGFVSLASMVLAALQDHGVCVLRTNEEGEVLNSHPETVVFVDPPVLLVNPSAIIDYDEENGRIIIDKEGCTLLKERVVVADTKE